MNLDIDKNVNFQHHLIGFIWSPISLGFKYIGFGLSYGLSIAHFGPS
jgi:hypothetical protein